MRFDNTDLVIRQRSTTDLLDLTLRTIHRYAAALSLYFAVGFLPFAVLNAFLLSWMVSGDNFAVVEVDLNGIALQRWRHAIDQIALIICETPLAGVFATYYLGQVTFRQSLSIRQLLSGLLKPFWRMILILGLIRGALIAPICAVFINRSQNYDPFWELLCLAFATLGISIMVRSFRPFAPEIVCLEQCPLISREPRVPSYRVRVRDLHAPLAGESVVRMIVIGCINGFGLICLLWSWQFVQGILAATWEWNSLMDFIILPLACWSLAGFSTVFRFLSYLDTRITLEGWEVELLLKAESARLPTEDHLPTIVEPRGAS